MSTVARRTLLQGLGGLGSAAALAACSTSTQAPAAPVTRRARTFRTGPAVTPTRGQRIVERVLTAPG